MLKREDTVLALIDVQGKLATLMDEREALYRQLEILLRGALALDLPILWVEQYPRGLGPTIEQLSRWLPDRTPLTKTCFSAWGLPAFRQALEETTRHQVLVAGIEAHVCVYQTARDLLAEGYPVEVVTDAVSSRTPANRRLGVERMLREGARPTSVEMALFELLEDARHPAFKSIAALVK